MNKRFTIALSYSGDKRAFVKKVADALSLQLGKKNIFYDKYYEAELARPDAAIYLQDIYQNQSELMVVFISKGYATSNWCGLEWHVVQRIIATKMGSGTIMLIRFDDTVAQLLNLSLDGYLDASNRNPRYVADEIMKRVPHAIIVNMDGGVQAPQQVPADMPRIGLTSLLNNNPRNTFIVIITLVLITLSGYLFLRKLNSAPEKKPDVSCIADIVQVEAMYAQVNDKLAKLADSYPAHIVFGNTDSTSMRLSLQAAMDSLVESEVKKNTSSADCYQVYKQRLDDSLTTGRYIDYWMQYINTKQRVLKDINRILSNRTSSNARQIMEQYNASDSTEIVLVDKDSITYQLDYFFHHQQITTAPIKLLANLTHIDYEEGRLKAIYCTY